MEFTGERYMPELQGDIRLEHMHRYTWCLPFVAGKRVLDIASGEGYGSFALAGSAATVTGVDISAEAVAHASQAYGARPNLSFLEGSAAAIPLADHSVDVVVSFETIEHHDQHEKMMAEIRRVLTPEGVLILSSPNKAIYSDLNGGHNDFHVKELHFDELDALLQSTFRNVGYFGQRVTATSVLQPFPGVASTAVALHSYTEGADGVRDDAPARIEPMYYVVVASNVALPGLPGASAFFSEQDNAFQARDLQLRAAWKEIDRLNARIAGLEQDASRHDGELAAGREALQAAQDEAQRAHDAAHHALDEALVYRQKLDEIYGSRGWRALQRVRAVLGKR